MKKNRAHYVTCGQMKLLEKRADEAGLSYYRMMERAGSGAAEKIVDIMTYKRAGASAAADHEAAVAEDIRFEISNVSPNNDEYVTPFVNVSLDNKNRKASSAIKAMIFCGKGNNGGDGFVAARLMSKAGYDVTVVLVDGKPVTKDAETNFRLLERLPINIVDMTEDERALMDIREAPHVAVDAIYGTGMKGELGGNGLKAAIYINRLFKNSETTVFALDIPSGLRGDLTNEKELERRSVTAHYTIVFHARKPVHMQKFAQRYCGRILVIDIGIDEEKLWNVEY